MFGLFKKRQAVPSAEELNRRTAAAREDVKDKWIQFNNTVRLKAEIPLSQKIDSFAQPVQQFFQIKYPVLLQGPTEIFWLTVFTAILESGTHPKEEVNAAISELRRKYARG
ncbi:MAG: hypothetical protein AABY73_06295 [Pseudomonadota bacterium]